MKVAVRAHLDEARPHAHPHTIEAARQIAGDILAKDEADDLFSGKAQPHLLHEPYMSAEGAAGMLDQTLAHIARKVDHEAEVRGTLASPEFEAFRRLVSSVYVGSLQKRAEHAEGSERLRAHKPDRHAALHSLDEHHAKSGGRDGGEGGEEQSGVRTMGIARPGHQTCSGDIAQALVAIAMGEGFERFSSTEVAADDSSHTKGASGADKTGAQASASPKGRRGKFGGGARAGAEGIAEAINGGGGSSSSSAEQQLRQHRQERANQERAAAVLQYLSENAESNGLFLAGGKELPLESGKDGNSVRSAALETKGSFPGLEWLAPHIVGRSIPMELRCVRNTSC